MAVLGANLLKLKPALEMRDGHLEVYKKYRGHMPQVYRQYVTERLSGKDIRTEHLFLLDSGDVPEETMRELEQKTMLLGKRMEALQDKLRAAGCTGEITTVMYEPVTGSHVGPDTLALFFPGGDDVRSK